jgi:serine/threonine protein kinase, bacterial
MESTGQLSPDGRWFWDGLKWLTTRSPDGQFRWDGRAWVASGAPAVRPPAGAFRRIPGLRTGAAWKLAVAGFVGLVLIGAMSNLAAQPPSRTAGNQVAVGLPSATPATESQPASPSLSASPSNSPAASPSPSPSPSPTPSPSPVAAATAAPAPVVAPPPPQDPYAAATAAGASAVCADGTWSYSKSRSGTCSSHGGVHWWTGNLGPAGPGAH